jgi:hypothetical protein
MAKALTPPDREYILALRSELQALYKADDDQNKHNNKHIIQQQKQQELLDKVLHLDLVKRLKQVLGLH